MRWCFIPIGFSLLFGLSPMCVAHQSDAALSQQAQQWLNGLKDNVKKAQRPFTDPALRDFDWLPGRRVGIPLDELTAEQVGQLKSILNHILSRKGAIKIDAVIATEAALAMLTNAPEYRNPEHYYTAVFGEPGPGRWSLRFEGHHLSLNIAFEGDRIVAATPLFIGANPETVPQGPDKGLRALASEVDFAQRLAESLTPEQKQLATQSNEWFNGFLTSPGSRRGELPAAIGIALNRLTPVQQAIFWDLIEAYVGNISTQYANEYLELIRRESDSLRFFWRGENPKIGPFYYRITGKRLLIEMETQGTRQHIHAIWRDVIADFGDSP